MPAKADVTPDLHTSDMTPDGRVAAVAFRQHALLTRIQSLEAGLTARQADRRLAAGRWLLHRRGVYAIAGAPPSERQAVLGALLAAGEGAMASHLTAARLWGFDLPPPDAIDVVGPRVRLEGVRSHQTSTLSLPDRARLGAIELTSPARTLADCAGFVPADRLGAVVDDALRRGAVKLRDLRACHERIDTGPGRRPTIALREVLRERAVGYSAGDSAREASIVNLLARSGLPAPSLGHRVRIGRRTYKLDIAWPELLLAIEFDGWDTHRTFTAFHGDRNRIRRLVAAGWTILPVTSKTDLHELIGDVTAFVASRPPLWWSRAN